MLRPDDSRYLFFLKGDVLEDDDDYLVDEFGQPVVSDGELGGDDSSEAMSSSAPVSKSPALTKKKQHPTYKGSSPPPPPLSQGRIGAVSPFALEGLLSSA